MQPIEASAYYQTWHGHTTPHLERTLAHLRKRYPRLVWLAGDSSLDNKAWVTSVPREPASSAYRDLLSPSLVVPDVCHWLNVELERAGITDAACINTAVEATTLGERESALRPQDKFLAQHLAPQDALVVSVGGNDIALAPTTATMTHLAALLLTPTQWLPRPLLALHPSFRYFVRLFRDGVSDYVRKLTAVTQPSCVVVCMIYFPCEQVDAGTWSERLLRMSGYDADPKRLQSLIRIVFEEATAKIALDNSTSKVIPVALFDVLDAANAEHYVQRVEPSSAGGRLMAQHLVEKLYGGGGNKADEEKTESTEDVSHDEL